MTDDVHLRRIPRQTRGQQRVARILHAAATLFAEVGYEATTTNAIAARAETSIGSLYQFFPNKEAILEALSQQYRDELRRLFEHGLPFDPSSDGESVLEVILDRVAAFYAERPGFQVVFYGSPYDDPLADAADEMYAAISSRMDAMLAHFYPSLPAVRRGLTASIIVKTSKALLPLAVAVNGTIHAEMMAEIKTVIRAYLRQVVSETPPLHRIDGER